ncbi:MAG TPA: hypothetical protein VJ547_07385 [Candidatus Thermoplasmatota archaeon]|nr:hypothetical protein [Candidatus Thermoplasmatota archaeon]
MEHEVLVGLRLAIVAVGGLVSLWAVRLASRTPDHRLPYLLLAGGFAFVTMAAVIEGALFEIARWDLVAAATAEALLSAFGFALILGAVWLSGVGAGSPPPAPPST